MACPDCAPRPMPGEVTISLLSGLMMLALTGACWGLVGFWISSGACYSDEYQLFFGLWLGSLVSGIVTVAFAWGGQAKFLAALGLLMMFGWIMLWLELGHIVVSACPLGGA